MKMLSLCFHSTNGLYHCICTWPNTQTPLPCHCSASALCNELNLVVGWVVSYEDVCLLDTWSPALCWGFSFQELLAVMPNDYYLTLPQYLGVTKCISC